MAQQIINTGTAPNDGTGDTLKTSFTKTNANFTELYAKPPGNAYTTSPTAPSSPNAGDFWYDTTTGILASYVNDGNSSQWVEVSPSVGNIASAGAFVNVQKFTSPGAGTYIPTPGTQFAIVECVAGGGGGGATSGAAAGYFVSAGGGGSGGYSRSVLTAAQIGSSQAIFVGGGGGGANAGLDNSGAGGSSSFGALVVANGGGGGELCNNGAAPCGRGGAGGPTGSGDIACSGAAGGQGNAGYSGGGYGIAPSGEGASGPFGGGGRSVYGAGGTIVGANATGFGSGGSGAHSGSGGANAGGGAGFPGIVIVTEYNIGPGQQGPAGLAGGVTTPLTPQGRLTLQGGLPVMSTTTAGATLIYYSPYVGNQIPIWNGTSWATMSFNELSVATTDTTKSPAAIGASKVNDWFVWNDAGTLRLSHGPDWASDTARSAGAAIARQNGIWINTQAITNGPAGGRGTYVGTTRSNASSQLDWRYGGIGNTAAAQGFFGVWNAYNRTNVSSTSGTTGSFSVNSGWTQNMISHQCGFVAGLAEDAFRATYNPGMAMSGGAYGTSGVALDLASNGVSGLTGYEGVANGASPGVYSAQLVGFHAVLGVDYCSSGTATFFGATTGMQCGFMFEFRM